MGRFERGLAKLEHDDASAAEAPVCFYLADGKGYPCDGSCSWCNDGLDLDELLSMDGLA